MFEIFQYDFMVRAFIGGLIIGVLAPTVGIFLIVKRYSLLADTLSHVSLVGVALASLLGLNPVVCALVVSSFGAVTMDRLRKNKKFFGESVLALFLSGSLALSLILFGLANKLNSNLLSYLFGSITTVSKQDLWLIGIFGLLAIFLIKILFKKLFLCAYDEDLAESSGLRVKKLNLILMVLAAFTVSLSMRMVGVLLVGALMVIPVLSASQISNSFKQTAIFSIAVSLISVIFGLVASYYLSLPSGAAIVAVSLCIFAVCQVMKKK